MTRDEAIRNLENSLHGFFVRCETTETLEIAIKALKQPEIVLCKDCKHRDPEDKKCDCGHDIQWQLPRSDNWFCADGEHK